MVCIVNICRGSIAEFYLKHFQPELNAFSSGIGALVGKPADSSSVKITHGMNIDLDNHSAQQINPVFVSNVGLILTMEQRHVEAIQNKFPESRSKVHLIGKWNDKLETPDPRKFFLTLLKRFLPRLHLAR